MADEIEALKAEFEKQLNAAKEIITGQAGAIDALTKKLEGLESEHKTLNEAFVGKQTAEVAATKKAKFDNFTKLLNAGNLSEAEKLYPEFEADPAGWLQANSTKLLNEAEAKDPKGKKQANSSGAFDLQAEQAKLWGY